MSVGSCSYLYQPEERFDANVFEAWFHSPQCQYQPEPEPEPEKEVPSDYVPEYSWFKAAAEHIRSCLKPKFIKPRVKTKTKVGSSALSYLIPPELVDVLDDEEVIWNSEANHARLCLIHAFKMLEEAKATKALTYKEHSGYVRRIQEIVSELERQLLPAPRKPELRLIPGLAKKK